MYLPRYYIHCISWRLESLRAFDVFTTLLHTLYLTERLESLRAFDVFTTLLHTLSVILPRVHYHQPSERSQAMSNELTDSDGVTEAVDSSMNVLSEVWQVEL